MAVLEQTPLYDSDNKRKVYDDKDASSPMSSSGITSRENASSGSASASSSSSRPNNISDSDKQASKESLNKAESGGGFYNKSSSAGSALVQGAKVGASGEVSATKTIIRGVSGLFVAHKKGAIIGGGVAGFFIFLAIFGAGFLVTHELVSIEKTLTKFEFKIEQHFEKKDASKIFKRLINLGASKSKPSPIAADEKLTTEMDAFDITSPQVVSDLAKAGITETTKGGLLTGLKNSSGQDITQDVANNTNGAFDAVETALPEWNVGQVEAFRPTLTEHAGSVFDPSTTTKPLDNNKAIVDEVLNGATETQLVDAAAVSDNETPPQNATSDNPIVQNANATDLTQQILDTANTDLEAGKSASAVVGDVSSKVGSQLGTPLLANTLVQDVCSVDKVATEASKTRVPKMLTLLVRHGTLLISLADELKAGALNGKVVNKVMGLFNGDPSAQSSINPTTHQVVANPASLPFSSSSGWQSATGGSGGVPIDRSSLPTKNAGTTVVSDINGVLKSSQVGAFTCSVENSPFGSIIGGLLNGAGVLLGGFSFGWLEAAQIAGITAFQYAIQHVIIPDILKYFTPFGMYGLENSTQWLNNADAGLNIASNDYARSLGANPVPNTTATQIASTATKQQNIADSHLSWVDRTLALSNTDSLASRILTHVPIGTAATINGAVSYIVNIPSYLLHNLSTIFYPSASALTAPPSAPGQVYGITQYAFTDSEIAKYDPLVNENYLFGSVTFQKNSVRRIDALGNPNTATVNTSGDELNSTGSLGTMDLLHCYKDSYTDLQLNTGGVDNNCGLIGDYDYNANTPTDPSSQATALDNTIVNIYCTALGAPPGSALYSDATTGCRTVVSGQVSDDIGHFRQYILDVHVMSDYTSLTTAQ